MIDDKINNIAEQIPFENDAANTTSAQVQDYVGQYGQDVVEKAKKWGWKEDYSNNETFLDPKSFVDNIENEVPNLRKLARKAQELEERVRKRDDELGILLKSQEIERRNRLRQIEREKDEALARFQKEHQAAVDDVDYVKAREIAQKELAYRNEYEIIKKDYEDLAKPNVPQINQQTTPQFTQDEVELLRQWTASNSWYASDNSARSEADQFFLEKLKTGLSVHAAVQEVEKHITPKYNRNARVLQERDTNYPTSLQSARVPNISRHSWDNLTTEGKAEYEALQDLYKRNKRVFTKEEFLKERSHDKSYWKTK